eukprot:4763713-Lingulodinium_polyedra.AAC.1
MPTQLGAARPAAQPTRRAAKLVRTPAPTAPTAATMRGQQTGRLAAPPPAGLGSWRLTHLQAPLPGR